MWRFGRFFIHAPALGWARGPSKSLWREPHESLLASVRVARGLFCRTEPVDLSTQRQENPRCGRAKSMSEIPERTFSGVRRKIPRRGTTRHALETHKIASGA